MKDSTESIYKKSGFMGTLETGKRPCILVVDFQYGFTDKNLSPLAGDVEKELINTKEILSIAREKNIPIIFCIIEYINEKEAGLWGKKAPAIKKLKKGSVLTKIDKTLDQQPHDIVIKKKYASAFAGTPIISILNSMDIDSLVITGSTTSGCVRATAVDAIQNGFISYVVEDAVYDRVQSSHESSLEDLQAKYSEVMETKDIKKYLKEV